MKPERETTDSQVVEILGRAHLEVLFYKAGIEVAKPSRDKGVDLVAYMLDPFKAVPIQIKAASAKSFSVHQKYERFPGLIMAYVWNLQDEKGSEVEVYLLTYEQAHDVARRLGWTDTRSWKRGGYSTSAPSREIITMLRPFNAKSIKLKERIFG